MLLLYTGVYAIAFNVATTWRTPAAPAWRAPALRLVESLDDNIFTDTLNNFDGLAVVKFYAPWCRTCRRIEPEYKRVANEMEALYPSRVRFYEVNFKQNNALCLRERVFGLPSVFFYTRGLGRVNGFTVKSATARKQIRDEVERYVGETNHLGLLQSLRTTALSPMVQYVDLVNVMQALTKAPAYAASAAAAPPAAVQAVSTEARKRNLDSLFSMIDANDDGSLDEDEIRSIAAAVGLGGTSSVTSLLQRINGPCEDEDALTFPLSREDFIKLMTSKAAADFSSPQSELMPAFKGLDKDGDGVITREEVLVVIERLSTQDFYGGGEMEKTELEAAANTAFDALDVDKSESLDYAEFVAMLSGTRTEYLKDKSNTSDGVME
uniref:Calmodulin n=1 Tax=Haptolina brevifila TaxID=156173 RepID=A0A7S2GGQ6_9EUKA